MILAAFFIASITLSSFIMKSDNVLKTNIGDEEYFKKFHPVPGLSEKGESFTIYLYYHVVNGGREYYAGPSYDDHWGGQEYCPVSRNPLFKACNDSRQYKRYWIPQWKSYFDCELPYFRY